MRPGIKFVKRVGDSTAQTGPKAPCAHKSGTEGKARRAIDITCCRCSGDPPIDLQRFPSPACQFVLTVSTDEIPRGDSAT